MTGRFAESHRLRDLAVERIAEAERSWLPWRRARLIREARGTRAGVGAPASSALAQSYQLAADLMVHVGSDDLAAVAAERALSAAAELSEEIRLAYVGLTRAKKNLFLTYSRRRQVLGQWQQSQPSRILRALPEENMEYRGTEQEQLNHGNGEPVREESDFNF